MGDTPKRPSQGKGSHDAEKASKEATRAKAAKRERSAWRWVWFGVKTALILIGGGIVLGIGAGTGYAAALLKGLPAINANTFTNTSQPSVVYDTNGKVIGKFEKEGNRAPLHNLKDVSPDLVNSFIAAEDRTFWTNIGINPMAMARAFVQDVTTHHIQSGASTITQQTVKLAVFPQQQRTLRRKVQEIALAIEANHILTKQEIMTDYMNWVYMGNLGPNPVYGVQAASQILFHKDVKNLNLPEATMLAAIPNNPYYYSPYLYDPKKGWSIDLKHIQQRQHYILGQMLQHGLINQSQYDSALNFDIKKDVHLPEKPVNQKYMYLMQDEIPWIVAKDLGYPDTAQGVSDAKNVLATGGYKIYTTIDENIQDHVKQVLSQPKWYANTLEKNFKFRDGSKVVTVPYNQYQFGATVIDNQTGAIVAIGGGNPQQGKNIKDDIDHSDLPRQPGSSIKPILDYGPAIDMHVLTAASVLNDAPVKFGGKYSPHDAESGWRGIVSARTALVQSYNVPAVEVLDTVGVSNADKYLSEMGITGKSTTITGSPTWSDKGDANLSSAIGGLSNGLTTQQMASAYTVFSNQGVWKQAYMVKKITNSSGQTVFQNKQTVRQVFSPQTAYILDSLMRGVVMKGTATIIGQHFGSTPIYGKTGTSDHQVDGWFIGFTQKYTTALWSGYDYQQGINYKPGIKWYAYNRKFYVWDAIMDPLVKAEKPKPIPNPGGIVQATVCRYSGQAPTPLCNAIGGTYSEMFIKGTEPSQKDQVHVQVEYTVVNGKKYLATTNTPPAQVQVGVFLKPPFPKKFMVGPNVVTNTSKYYVPTQPDPRGGTVLQPLSSSQLVTPPAAPQNITASAQNASTVQLQWAPVTGADSYTIYRATSQAGPYTEVTTSGPITGTSFIDSSIQPGTQTVYYEVYAIQNKLRSLPSSPVQVDLTGGGGQGGQSPGTTGPQNATGGP